MRLRVSWKCLLLIVLACWMAGTDSSAKEGPAAATCEEFVLLDEGKLMLEGRPYGLKGVNITLNIGADPRLPPDEGGYFLIPYGAYRPQNYSLRHESWMSPTQTCKSEATCRSMLINEQLSRLQSLQINSVRIVGLGAKYRIGASVPKKDRGKPYYPVNCTYIDGQPTNPKPNCDMDLTNPTHRARFIELVREAIHLLGERGIRTILHTAGGGAARDEAFEPYLDWLGDLSQALANDPYLVAYDPMNEPEWFYDPSRDDPSFDNACDYLPGGRDLCKGTAQRVSKAWFDALTQNDPRHFVTIGLANPYLSTRVWDPFVLWDHFTSYHIYTDGRPDDNEWFGANGFSESEEFSNQIYLASLGGCGVPCPYLGTYDGANCFVAQGTAGQAGSIRNGGFFTERRSSGNPCPVGTLDHARCKVGEFDPGRDEPWMTTAPTYYLEPSPNLSTQHGCPPGSGWDGVNCVIAHGPPGAVGFVADNAFYYHHLTGVPDPCRSGDVDEGNRCKVADIPPNTGAPFILDKALFYVESVQCGPRKPLHFGETAFLTYRDGVQDDPCPFPNGGTLDALGCYLKSAPPGRAATDDSASRDFFYFKGQGGCEAGFTPEGLWCKLRAHGARGVLIREPLYYVEPVQGQCPNPGDLPDAVGCLVAEGPRGLLTSDGHIEAQPFVYDGNFYYHYLDPAGVHCALPGQDDTRNCLVAPVPAGYRPILSSRAHFYYNHCRYDGSDADAVDFLEGGSSADWEGVFPYGHSCGFQGLHWWQFADVHHQVCQETLSLFAHGTTRLPYTPLDPAWLQEKDYVPTFRYGLDFSAPPLDKCEKPADFHAGLDRRTTTGARYTFRGTVQDQHGDPVANAVVKAWEWHPNKGNSYAYWTTTDARGNYEVRTQYCLERVSASAFGYETSDYLSTTGFNPYECSLPTGTYSAPSLSITRLAAASTSPSPSPPYAPQVLNTALLNPPSTRRVACQDGTDWVLRP